MGDHHDFSAGGHLSAGAIGFVLHDRLNRHASGAEAAADLANHAGLIAGEQAQVVAVLAIKAINQAAAVPAAGRQQGIEAS